MQINTSIFLQPLQNIIHMIDLKLYHQIPSYIFNIENIYQILWNLSFKIRNIIE